MKDRLFKTALVGFSIFTLVMCAHNAKAERIMQYAQINYDVVYVRCPRGNEPVNWMGTKSLLNWNGVNDMWLSASNNIYQQPGCDLVLHHSNSPLPLGDPGREEVLVNCDDNCTVADPTISPDGNTIVYTKFTDTSGFVANDGIGGSGGLGAAWDHLQSGVTICPNGDCPGYGKRFSSGMRPYIGHVLLYKYDLTTRTETRISPVPLFEAGRAYPNRPIEWTSNVPVMDTGPAFIDNSRLVFTSNRDSGFYRFQLFTMDINGDNLTLIGHRAMNQQLHPQVLTDGRVCYTNFDPMLIKVSNNQYSLWCVNPDGSDPFILAGKYDPSHETYHFFTQLSDGDIVTALYYNHNNGGMGTLLRFPIDPQGPDFYNPPALTVWQAGVKEFLRIGEYILTPDADAGDSAMTRYSDPLDYWTHPSNPAGGRPLVINGITYYVDAPTVTMRGRFTHPASAPYNDLLATYTIGASSTMGGYSSSLPNTLEQVGKNAGIVRCALMPNGSDTIGHIADACEIVVDFPEYHEIMARAAVPYADIYGIPSPGISVAATDPRIPAGAPYGTSGAASTALGETRPFNGIPWNMRDGGGACSGRTYTNLCSAGAALRVFEDNEVAAIRVLMPVPGYPSGEGGNVVQGAIPHALKVYGEFPVHMPDTGFIVKLPADTPFLFQALDRRGLPLNIETASRSVRHGEQQVCSGCHLHTQEGPPPTDIIDPSYPLADATQGGQLFTGEYDANGGMVFGQLPGLIKPSKLFAIDWANGVSQIIETRCASCHGEGTALYSSLGFKLDGSTQTYDYLVKNSFKNSQNITITDTTSDTDRITRKWSCCRLSRQVSVLSSSSSMLIWALYGERLDGRDPLTGLPYPGSGVIVDNQGKEYPETWPNVEEHAAYVVGMPEAEKRALALWIDTGMQNSNVHNDLMRPVLTVTPVINNGVITNLLVGVWDDSELDYPRFKVEQNGVNILPNIVGTPDVIDVTLNTPIDTNNAAIQSVYFEIWDKPNRDYSVTLPGTPAANRTKQTYTGLGLFGLAGVDTAPPPPVNPCDVNTASFECCVTTPTNACVPQNPAWFIYDTGTQVNQCFTLY